MINKNPLQEIFEHISVKSNAEMQQIGKNTK